MNLQHSSEKLRLFCAGALLLLGCAGAAKSDGEATGDADALAEVAILDTEDVAADSLDAAVFDGGDTASNDGLDSGGGDDIAVTDAVAPADASDAVAPTDAADAAETSTGDVGSTDATSSADASPDVAAPTCECGDGVCGGVEGCAESPSSCPADCIGCGDGKCAPGEGPISCAVDCCGACGDGKCKGYGCGESPATCAKDCGTTCGNGTCEGGESPTICPGDCLHNACGNGLCEPTDGGPNACPEDCGSACGNCLCDKGENPLNCPVDCGSCGDGTCSFCNSANETPLTCAKDCQGAECLPSDVSACNDGNSCTIDKCTPAMVCIHAPAPALCDDGDPCSVGDVCKGTDCQPGAFPLNCNDGDGCTYDLCAPMVGCQHLPATDEPCSDGSKCTLNDACFEGKCVSGDALDCDDGNPCTDDGCAAQKGCTHTANGDDCDDGNGCTLADQCAKGACVGTPLACSDNNVCTADACSPVTGCSHTPLAGYCDDGNACTASDVCQGTVCTGVLISCNDDNGCTSDHCDQTTGCGHTAVAATCDDGNACSKQDACADGVCQGITFSCDDGNPCTADVCSGATGCGHPPADGYCDDGNACTANDACQNSACVGKTLSCDDSNVCTSDTCIPASGCAHSAVASACDDGNVCTSGDVCGGGYCTGAPISCDDGSPCTSDACDKAKNPDTGCVHAPAAATCTDGDACTIGDSCLGGSCKGGTLDCNDKDTCTDDWCDTAGGCVHLPNTAACDDGSDCTVSDHCSNGVCAGEVSNCDDGMACTMDACIQSVGCGHVPTDALCNDGNSCTTDVCSLVGECTHQAVSGPCDDGQPCTAGEVCTGNTCAGGHAQLWTASIKASAGVTTPSALAWGSDGSVLVVGTQASAGGAFATAYDPAGNLLWSKHYDAPDSTSGVFYAADATSDGWVVSGRGSCSFTPGTTYLPNPCTSWIVRLSAQGNVLWTWSRMHGTNNGQDINDIAVDVDGTIIGAGASVYYSNNFGWSTMRGFVRLSANGAVVTDGFSYTTADGSTYKRAIARGDGSFWLVGSGPIVQYGDNEAIATVIDANDTKIAEVILKDGSRSLNDAAMAADASVWATDDAGKVHHVSGNAKSLATWSDPDGAVSRLALSGGDLVANGGTSVLHRVSTGGVNLWRQIGSSSGMTNEVVSAIKAKGDGRVAILSSGTEKGTGVAIVRLSIRDAWNATTCQATGACYTLPPLSCADSNVCTDDFCTPTSGTCAHTSNLAACDDGSACTTEQCLNGTCAALSINCDDQNACTLDGCDPLVGCQHQFSSAPCGPGLQNVCYQGACCQPDCTNKVCGDNGCGGTCGACTAGTACGSDFTCQTWDPKSMAFVPAGSFWMGCDAGEYNCESSSQPKHLVSLSPYYIGRMEVTVAQYQACVDAGKCSIPDITGGSTTGGVDVSCNWGVTGHEQHPINCVSWAQASTYCAQMIPGGRLPTEAQWERAARGDCATLADCTHPPQWPWGNGYGWCGVTYISTMCSSSGLPETAPVGSYPGGTSAFYGLFDMVGNVGEWMMDVYDPNYYSNSPTKDPKGPASGSGQSIRGQAEDRPWVRHFGQPDKIDALGFRCAKTYP